MTQSDADGSDCACFRARFQSDRAPSRPEDRRGDGPALQLCLRSGPQGPVFQSVTVSSNQLNWDNTCETIPVTFTAQTQIGFNVTEVLLFLRLQNQAGTDTTFWNKAITMHSAGLGAFTYDITPDKINHYLDFNTAWIQYQLVAYNAQLHEVGRTQIYENTLTLTRCP